MVKLLSMAGVVLREDQPLISSSPSSDGETAPVACDALVPPAPFSLSNGETLLIPENAATQIVTMSPDPVIVKVCPAPTLNAPVAALA